MVDSGYLGQFRNEEVLERLIEIPIATIHSLREEHKSQLSEKDKKRYEDELKPRIVRREKMFTFGIYNLQRKASRILQEVQECVKTTLAVGEIEACTLTFSTTDESSSEAPAEYDLETKTIVLKEEMILNCSTLVQVLTHESAHHLLSTFMNCPYFGFQFFHEGYAHGMERNLPEKLPGNSRKMRNFFHRGRKYLSLDPLQNIDGLIQGLPRGIENLAERALIFRHEIGYALFAILEAERGPDVYRQIVHGEFKW